jgi:outer membrane protein assembly factor BamD
MKILYKLLILLVFASFYSCSKEEKVITTLKETDQELEMISTYKIGMESFKKGDYFFASKKFLESELLFPQSEWAAKSVLMASYSYYMQDYYSEAVFNLERYLSTYPNDESIAYGHYLLAMCFYENIENEKKDLGPLTKAKNKFAYIVQEYPNSDFALSARLKMDLINDVLASKEMYIGRHYIKKEKWIAAINRFKIVVENYDTTIYVEEAIHRLVEIYYYLGLKQESKKYANLLGYNYGSSQWYKSSYKLFNQNYKIKTLKINKKKKKGMLKKFKSLFE